MRRCLALFALLLVSARQEDPDLDKAVQLLQTDAAKGVAALEKIAEEKKGTESASRALLTLARHWLRHRETAKAVDALRRHQQGFGPLGAGSSAEDLVEEAIGKNFTDQPDITFTADRMTARVQPRHAALVQYKLIRIDPEHLRKELRAGRSPVLRAPLNLFADVKTWTERFDPNRPREAGLDAPGVPPGYYLLEEEIEGFAKRWPAMHYSSGLLVKFGRDQVFAFAYDPQTGAPVSGMALELHAGGVSRATTDKEGRAVFPKCADGWIVGLREKETHFCRVYDDFEDDADAIAILTDRPIYRPGQVVQFRAVLRDREGRTLKHKKEKAYTVEISDTEDRRVYRRELPVSAFGTLHGSFQLGDEPSLGTYVISLFDEHHQEIFSPHTTTFRVAAYRKPEIRVDIQAAPSAKPGQEVRATIEAKYLFGSPAAGAQVTWTVSARELWTDATEGGAPSFPKDHPYAWYLRSEWEEEAWYEDEIAQGTGTTDKDGRLMISFKPRDVEFDVAYGITAEVVDESRRPSTATREIRVTRSDLRLSLLFGRNFYRAGEPAVLHVVAADLQGAPAANRKVALRAFQSPAEGEWEEFARAESATDARGAARFDLTIDRPGEVRFKAVCEGAVTRAHLWAAGEDLPGRDAAGTLDLFVLSEQYVHRAGERASLFVRSSIKDTTALLTVETDRVIHSEIVKIPKRGRLIEVALPDDAAPTAVVKLHAWKGGKPGGAGLRLLVIPRDRWLDVTVKTDRESYRPREKAKVTLEVHDGNGKPVEAEVSLGAVDEAIYLLAPDRREDIRRTFYPPDLDWVSTLGSGAWRDDVFDPFDGASGRTALTGATFTLDEGEESTISEAAPTETRSFFPDTLFWGPTIRTDANGRAQIDLDVADSLTTWIFTAHAVGSNHQVGQGRSTTLVRKNVVARLVAPRTMTQGDEATISVVVHNDLASKETFAISLEAKGAEIVGTPEVRETIESRGVKRVEWRVRTKEIGTATFTAKALGAKESDAMELDVRVKPHGMLRVDGKSGEVKESVIERISVPKDAVAPELTIVVSPGAGATVLDALPYLAGYPYGCVEQTMSRFLPSLMTQRALAKLGVKHPRLEQDLPKMLESGLQRLYHFQHEDGGWGWWRHDATNPWMTAYVVMGLSEAKAAGVPLDERVLERAVAALQAMLVKAPDAYLLWALAHEAELPEAAVKSLRSKKLEPRDRLHLALAFLRRGRKDEARPLLEDLGGSGVEESALHLKALLQIDPAHRRAVPLVQGLLASRRGVAWVSTRDSAFAIYALTDYIVASGELTGDHRVTVAVNGREVFKGAVTRETLAEFSGVIRITDLKAENEVKITGSRSGLFYSTRLRYYEAGEPLRPLRGALVVARRYDRVVRWGDEEVLEPLESGSEVRPGDVLQVTITMRSETGCSNVLLEDPMPAGCEAVEEDEMSEWSWWYCRREYRDDRVSIAANEVDARPQVFTYRLRAMIPGTYHVLPAQAADMYDPARCGASGEMQLRIVEK